MRTIKKTVACLVAAVMLLSLLPASALALNGVSYLDANGVAQTANGVTGITSGSTALSAGWYVVTADTEISSRITCTGAV